MKVINEKYEGELLAIRKALINQVELTKSVKRDLSLKEHYELGKIEDVVRNIETALSRL